MAKSCWVIVPAAGRGARMAADRPKQYLRCGTATVIELTLRRLLAHPDINHLMLVLHPGDTWWSRHEGQFGQQVERVDGGAERADSVWNALLALKGRAQGSDLVLVHDVARPCVRLEDIDRLLTAAESAPGGVLLGAPVVDTLKRIAADGRVAETIPRAGVYRALTPQIFPFELLYRALQNARESAMLVTDEASAVEALGVRPLLLEGAADNLKITRTGDLELAALYLAQQLPTSG